MAPSVAPGELPDPTPPPQPPDLSVPLEDIEEIIGSQPTIPPPEGEGTTIRATIGPVDDVLVGDIVTIDAANLPPGQSLAWGQCNEDGKDSEDLFVLLVACALGGLGVAGSDGTVQVSMSVTAQAGGVDCLVDPCYIGIVVLPGTADFRRYERVTVVG